MAIKRWNASTSQWELVGTPGTATPAAIGAATLASGGNTFLGVQTITAASEWPLISRFTNPTSTHRNHLLMQRSNNNAAVTAGFNLGGISMAGHDGTSYALGWNGGAEITAYASQTWTPTARGTDLVFAASYSNTTGPSERFRIAANDTFGFNVSAPAYGIHHRVFGNAEIATQYGTGAATYIGAYAAEGSLRVSGSNPLTFYTNNTEAMRIDAVQNLQIGAASEFNGLRYIDLYNRNSGVNAGTIIRLITNNAANTAVTTVDIVKYRNGTFLISNNDTGASAITQFSNAGAERMRIDGNGYLLVGYTSSNGAYRLQVNSQIFATSSSIATSDGRYKENVLPISSGLDIIDSLNPVSFDWKEHPVHNFVEGKTVGFIAQEVKEALKDYEWVNNIIKTNTTEAVLDEDGNEVTPAEEFLGIAESNMIPLLVAAVKELRAEVNTLKAQISN